MAISTILAGLCFIVLFVLRQLNREKNDIQPMLDVRLFRNTVFTGAITANLISMMVDVGFIYFASQHLQLVSGLPPMYAGMLLIPGTLAIIIAGLVIARVAVHFHPAQVVSFGLALHAAAFAVLAFLGAHNDLVIILIFIVLGTGIGIAQTISNDLMLSSVPPRKAGAASAISETSYEQVRCSAPSSLVACSPPSTAQMWLYPTAWMRLSPTTLTKPSAVPCPSPAM